jgi:hypothetical protein
MSRLLTLMAVAGGLATVGVALPASARRYDLAPQVVLAPVTGLEVATGYRIGNLHDPGFAARGGNGFFLAFGVRVTERTAASAAAFWRERVTR